MPTCGTQYYRYSDGSWHQVYAENLSEDQKARALAAVETAAKELGYWESETWGPILEDRGSQITFSALGQAAPVAACAQRFRRCSLTLKCAQAGRRPSTSPGRESTRRTA